VWIKIDINVFGESETHCLNFWDYDLFGVSESKHGDNVRGYSLPVWNALGRNPEDTHTMERQ